MAFLQKILRIILIIFRIVYNMSYRGDYMLHQDLLDEINIKTFPEAIIEYLKSKNTNSKFNNLRSFYSLILGSISTDVKESYLNRILKYLSADEESQILILDDIGKGLYEKELTSVFSSICEKIEEKNSFTIFYKKLLDSCKLIYFEKDESEKIKTAFDCGDYVQQLYLLFLHACQNYRTNTPNILAERLLTNSFSILEGKKVKYELLKASADLGNTTACLLYGNAILDRADQFNYFFKGRALPQNIWEIAFLFEKGRVNVDIYNKAKKEFKTIINIGEKFLGETLGVRGVCSTFEMDCMLLAFNLYLYLANVKNFPKAFNSVGKLLIKQNIVITSGDKKIDEEKAKAIGLDYLRKGIKLGNINAIQNYVTYLYEERIETPFDLKSLITIGANAKDIPSAMYLSKMLLDEKRFDEAEPYLKFLADCAQSYAADSQYSLAKIYENKLQLEDAVKYYEKAINNGLYDASFSLAKLYFNKAMSSGTAANMKKSYLIMAVNLIESYFHQYDEAIKKEAALLLDNMKNLIGN